MTKNSTSSIPSFDPPQPGDPRYSFAIVTSAVGDLIAGVEPDQLAGPTPCPEFQVKDLLEHVVMVMRRVAAIGGGEHWSSVETESVEAGWHDDYRDAARQTQTAWTDPAKLEGTYEAPWGQVPGVPLMWTYVAELAVHGWDIGQSTGQSFSLDDKVIRGALAAIKFVPAEGRDDPNVPFTQVVDPGPGASTLLQMAGWAGRPVLS